MVIFPIIEFFFYVPFICFKIAHTILVTEHTSDIDKPVNRYQNTNLRLNFDDGFDSDDEVIFYF